MNYRFKKIDFSYGAIPSDKVIYDFGVDYDSLEENEKSLFQIAWNGWTLEEIQMIIDKSRALQGNQEYEHQVAGSDLLIIIDKNEIHFFDAHSEQEEADLIWSFEKFIDFMEQFKKFVEENN